MKKTVCLLLAVVMLLSLVACGKKAAPSQSESAQAGVQEALPQSEGAQDGVSEGSDTPKEDSITFTEVTVVDNDECTIKITGLDTDGFWGYTLKALLENKSADKTYMFSVNSAAINGVQTDPYFAAEVAAGKKSNNDISFSDGTLEKNGVGEYTDIELTFRVYDSNDWTAEPVANETVHIYPYGEDKAVKFVRESEPGDTVLVDNDSVAVIVTDYEKDGTWGYTVDLFLLNKTDKEVMFSADEASVNGFMADPFYATSVSAGKCAFSSMSWSYSTLEENGITDVETIEFKLRAYDAGDWSASDLVNEVITLNP